ncbi:hypothetical protein BHE74_00015645 [Ensete ventricosum]|nr:hypothetical protein BHE74_00015645 [Ensete ventricosum]
MGGTYWSIDKPVRGLPAITGQYHGFSLVPSDIGFYQALTVEISTVTTRYSISIVAAHYSAVSAWLRRGKKKQ